MSKKAIELLETAMGSEGDKEAKMEFCHDCDAEEGQQTPFSCLRNLF